MFYYQISNQVARDLLHRIYPYLIVKQRQAALGIYLQDLLSRKGTKRPGGYRSDTHTTELERIWATMKLLNHFGQPDMSWVPEPQFGRWADCERYYYNADAIAEPVSPAMLMQIEQGYNRTATKDYAAAGAQDPSATKSRIVNGKRASWRGSDFDSGKTGEMMETRGHKQRKPAGWATGVGAHGSFHREGRAQEIEYTDATKLKRNKRSVWTVTTQPFSSRLLRGASGDSDRIVSPDCPIHAVQSYLASKAQDDALPAASQSVRNPRSDAHPELWPQDGHVSIDQRRDADSFPDNSDSLDPACVETATPHNIESHRTGRALLTSPREIRGAESRVRIADNEQSHDSDASDDRIPESNTGLDYGSGARVFDRAEQNPDRNVCTCAYKDSIDHFAVFPPALIEPCILAGSKSGDVVLDPFMGSGTTGEVAQNLGRRWVGCELNADYKKLQDKRTAQQAMIL